LCQPELPVNVVKPTTLILSEIEVSQDIVLSVLLSLDLNKATGPDGIGNIILKNCDTSLCLPISIIAALSLRTGTFPSIWKTADIVQIF